jgi:hypothetical protein
MMRADEFREIAESFELWARSAKTEAERRDFLDMADRMRRAADDLDADDG